MQNRRNFLGWHRPRHLFGTEEPRKVYFNNTCVERARRRFFDGLYYFSFSSFSLKCLKKRDNRYLPLSVSSLIREILKKKKTDWMNIQKIVIIRPERASKQFSIITLR